MKPTDILLLWIAGLGLLLRIAVVLLLPDQNFPDAAVYERAGRELMSGGLMDNHVYMPLFPLWTWLTGGGLTLKLADAAVSAATVWLIGRLALDVFKDERAALIAALAAAVYPHFLFYAASRLTETLHLFVLCLCFLAFYRGRQGWGAFLLALSLLIKPSLELLAPVLVAAFSLIVHREGWRKALKRLAVYGCFYLALMTPWWAHNYAKYGQFVRLTLADGIVLYSGNNPLNESGGGVRSEHTVDMDLSLFSHVDDPVARNDAMKRAAFDYIRSDPWRFVEMAGVKFVRFWRLWPYAPDYEKPHLIAASLASYGVMLAACLGFLARFGWAFRREILPMLLLAGFLTAVHMATIGSVRYRLPLEPFILILGSVFLARLPVVERLTRRLFPA